MIRNPSPFAAVPQGSNASLILEDVNIWVVKEFITSFTLREYQHSPTRMRTGYGNMNLQHENTLRKKVSHGGPRI